MVRLEYEPFFDFSKVKLQKKKGSRFPSKSSRLAASINAASQHENETQKTYRLLAGLPRGHKHRQTKKILKAPDLMTRPI